MKKLILLLLVISTTALEAQNYQYFTAKQGIPKALEIAKAYFKNDSVNLYSIKCVRWINISDTIFPYQKSVLIDSINPYNESTGTSLYWYYLICDTNDSCNYFRIWNKAGDYEVDSVFKDFKRDYLLLEKDILIDTDSLVKCVENIWSNLINYSELIVTKDGYPFHNGSVPVWYYEWKDLYSTTEDILYINTKTCESYHIVADVSEKKHNNSIITIKSDPNTDNITIELNSDLFQEAELNLYDQVGVLLFSDKLNNKSYQLSTYNYPSGLYILQIKHGGDLITKTVMIVH
ncbi:MAG: hypothetical protein A2X61_00520 [Ignavibacteria bacterium GWB2_35_12]|nr:MAG: hypothetical protein A2X63_09775 [Ignavibacteria bacterium GWA2_35_8]OGU42601.1 MAG: hypothetical protein A2X61_00520 [Ignavibacteria bacterium GWB2_35_12]OGU96434.1 MAG: hypothetical protein A2220_07720 [Ignavibacteria bacterium RIFOXYA2_FULL_35_10]OGV18597.1 MAG: hypothetical protein A2475_07570 [Ignavibacteria bacterium RIFOXYC2_FULL_35_21]